MIPEIKKRILEGDKEALKLMLSKEPQISLQEAKELIELSKKKGIKIIESILINRMPETLEFYKKEEKENLIVDLISEISENIYPANWYDKIENELWAWIKDENSIPDGIKHRIVRNDLKELEELSKNLNLWATWQNGNHPQAIDLTIWKEKKK